MGNVVELYPRAKSIPLPTPKAAAAIRILQGECRQQPVILAIYPDRLKAIKAVLSELSDLGLAARDLPLDALDMIDALGGICGETVFSYIDAVEYELEIAVETSSILLQNPGLSEEELIDIAASRERARPSA